MPSKETMNPPDPRALAAAEKYATTFDDCGLPLWLRSRDGFLAGIAWARDAAGPLESPAEEDDTPPCLPGKKIGTFVGKFVPEPVGPAPPASPPSMVWIRWGSNWCEGHLTKTPDEVPYVPEAALQKANAEVALAQKTFAAHVLIPNEDYVVQREVMAEQMERIEKLETILKQAKNKFEKIAAPPEFPARDKEHAEAQRDRCRLMAQEFLDRMAKAPNV